MSFHAPKRPDSRPFSNQPCRFGIWKLETSKQRLTNIQTAFAGMRDKAVPWNNNLKDLYCLMSGDKCHIRRGGIFGIVALSTIVMLGVYLKFQDHDQKFG